MALDDLTPVVREERLLSGEDLVPETRLEYFLKGAGAAAGKLAEDVEVINDLLEISGTVTEKIYNGYGGGVQQANFALSPFILATFNYDRAPYYITALEVNFISTGLISVGTIPKEKAVLLDVYDPEDVTIIDVIEITETGRQVVELEPFILDADSYMIFGMPDDTAIFGYSGAGATENMFYYISNAGKFINSLSCIGVDVYADFEQKPDNVREVLNSVYSGKSLSILGDSISTYSGYIPEGQDTYYPTGTVQSVDDTWWKKVIDALGLTLNVNNSWSGTYVTTAGGATSAGCGDRAEALGTNPDVIIVYMGINDFNNEVALGSYDGESAIPVDTTTFREAYGIMLDKVLTAYKSAEVWVCTLPQCERNGSTGFPEINGNNVALNAFNNAIRELSDAFGVKLLDLAKCGLTYQNMSVYNPDNLHPNKYGHSLIANYVIACMDNTVSTRYET